MTAENGQTVAAGGSITAAVDGNLQHQLDRGACYRALASRDARFDGRFFVAVRTTGIYCRPVCRVRLPRLENVEFFACAAAAEHHGFRACRRCRPESAPGSSAWLGTEATVARALRLVDAGVLDNAAVGDLAARVGVGERHLRRLFDRHLGVAPNDLALTRRLHLARRLLDDSSLKIADVALAAGFGSVRRFNDAMRGAFGFAPATLRGASQRSAAGPRATRTAHVTQRARLELKLAYRPPYDWDAMLAFLAPRAIAGVEAVASDSYQRVLRTAEGCAAIRVTCNRERHHLVVAADFDHPRVVDVLYRGAARVFDTSADPAAVAEVLGRDAVLAPLLAANPGLRVPGCWSAWEAAIRAVVGQQISVSAAVTALARFADRFGTRVATPLQRAGAPTLAFPLAADIARLRDSDLDGLGLTNSRAATLLALARAVDSGVIDLGDGADPAAARASLAGLRGIGPWTAAYVALRGLGDPDALPDADLGLLHALGRDGVRATARQLTARAESWKPWRSYAVVHLWNGLNAANSAKKSASAARPRRKPANAAKENNA